MKTPISSNELSAIARALRLEIVEALYACGGGHYGGVLSVLDIVLSLYGTQMRNVEPGARNPDRDRFILSKGHAALALYGVLRHFGLVDGDLTTYGAFGSKFSGHPDSDTISAVDFSTGSLGQGLSAGLGMALVLPERTRVWVVLGDGECQEGQVWEAAMLAARLSVPNLNAIVDANGFQEWGWTQDTARSAPPVERLDDKWRAFGWQVLHADGHDHDQLVAKLATAAAFREPTVIIAHTTKGRGFAMAESDPIRFHCTTLDADDHARLLKSSR